MKTRPANKVDLPAASILGDASTYAEERVCSVMQVSDFDAFVKPGPGDGVSIEIDHPRGAITWELARPRAQELIERLRKVLRETRR